MPVAEHRTNPRYSPDFMNDVGYAPSSSSSEEVVSEKGSTHYSSSRRVLAHVLARKERDAKQMTQLLRLSFAKLDQESQRAVDAERRATECLVRARTALDARAVAEAEAARVREELGMYKVQLEQAQREIFRAQEILDGVEARRREAEEEAVRARTVARKLQEEKAVDAAREEGRKAGWRDGVRKGWRMGYEEAAGERRAREERTRSRPRRGLEDALFSEVDDEPAEGPDEGSSGSSSLVNVPSRGVPEAGNGSVGLGSRPPIPTLTTPFRSPSPDPTYHTRAPSRHRTPDPARYQPADQVRHRTPEPPRHRTPEPSRLRTPEPSRHRAADAPRPRTAEPHRHRTPEPRTALPVAHDRGTEHIPTRPYTPHTRPYTPHESAPSIITPIPVHNPSPTLQHRPVSVPPDGWIPHAQDANGDGRLEIYMPPPHEMADAARGPQLPFVVVPTPEGGSPQVVPPPGEVRSRDYAYANAMRDPGASTSALPQRINKVASNNSRASTHLSEYELLAPVEGPVAQSTMGPVLEDDELEYVDAPAAPVRQVPQAVPPQPPHRRHAHDVGPLRRGPRRPREIVFPAPLGPAVEQLARPPQSMQPIYAPPRRDSDSPVHSERDRLRPHRSRTSSSGVIGITVEPPSPGDSTPSPDNTVISQPDLLTPDHAHRPLPAPVSPRTLTPLPEFAELPPGFVPMGSSSSNASSAAPYTRSRTPAYEAAPIPSDVHYPASPIAQAKDEPVEGELAPLSPLASTGFLGFVPKKFGWRRNTADK
ncbi:hypothetical protein BV25DRAFT_1917459 [Artomyces pyxidatus]|uniref:Uncharacterized protein n=1 Tax=Artomyces pyxidatus TaxID=48021 RepID=A0ACB8SWD6_9AGAM|nr:hypothetical protein BV25DRAFT_1917459 [Artomyces pyxidatus]